MIAAFHALLMPESQTRFGSYRLDYLWAPLEVILRMAIMSHLWYNHEACAARHGLYAVFGGRIYIFLYDAKNCHTLTRCSISQCRAINVSCSAPY